MNSSHGRHAASILIFTQSAGGLLHDFLVRCCFTLLLPSDSCARFHSVIRFKAINRTPNTEVFFLSQTHRKKVDDNVGRMNQRKGNSFCRTHKLQQNKPIIPHWSLLPVLNTLFNTYITVSLSSIDITACNPKVSHTSCAKQHLNSVCIASSTYW